MTATTTQLSLYNKALRHLGERKLASVSEEREARRYLDDEYTDTLLLCLRSGLWNFATRAIQIDNTGAITPQFGYLHAFEKPCDWVRTSNLSDSPTFDFPIRDYQDQQGYWLANSTPLYVRYVSKDIGCDLAKWPVDFVEYVAVALARAIAARITQDQELVAEIEKRAQLYFERAIANDARDAPPVSWPSTYNFALRYLPEKALATLDDNSDARRFLDDDYNRTVLLCLRNGNWNFATKSVSVSSSAAAAGSGYDYEAAKPADWVRTTWVSASSTYDPILRDYRDQGGYWLSNAAELYVRYVSNDIGTDETVWPPDFREYVAVALALAVAPRIGVEGEVIAALEQKEAANLERALKSDAKDQPNISWPPLYDVALRHLGERFLAATTPEENAEIRRYLDTEYDNTVALCLRAGLWNFASVAINLTPDATPPDFGFQSRFAKPADWIRTSLISNSETFDPPLRLYQDQGGYWYANTDTLYVRYVSSTLGTVQANWPADFYEYVSVALARMIAPRILDPQQVAAIEARERLYWKRAIANDAMDQPPSPWPLGTWTTSRIRRGGFAPYSNTIRGW